MVINLILKVAAGRSTVHLNNGRHQIKMNFKFLLLTLSAVTLISLVLSDDEDSCKWLYRCCKKIREQCVKVCEPEIVCETTEQPFSPFAVIEAPVFCGKGQKMFSGKCRKTF